MASGSKKVESIRSILSNFDFSRNSSFKARLWDLGQKVCQFYWRFQTAYAKSPQKALGSGGRGRDIDSDIDFKKKEQIVIFRGEKLREKKSFPMAIGNGLYLVEPH